MIPEPAPPSVMPSSSRSRWYVAAGLATGAVFFWLALRRVDWAGVTDAVREVSLGWLALGVGAYTLTQIVLAARWRVLVNTDERMSVADAFDFLMIGTAAGLVLPARLGDVARAVAAGRFHSLSASRLLGTILVEKLLDVILLLAFSVALSALMAIPAVVQGALVTLLVAAVVVTAVVWMGEAGPLGLVRRLLTWLRGPLSRSLPMFARFLDGLATVRQRGRLPAAAALAALGWVCSAAASACHLAAFDLAVPWYAGAFVVVVINLGGILPAPPGGVGVYHYLAMLALSPWAVDSSTAFAFALVTHALAMATTLTLGSVCLARKGLSVRGLRELAAAGGPGTPVR